MISFSEDEQDNLHKWATLLRETPLPQGKTALARNGHYCCLGVWAENILGPERWIEPAYTLRHEKRNEIPVQTEKSVDGMWMTILPPDMENALGLQHEIAGIQLRRYFWMMNDYLDLSFLTIAEHIDYLLTHGTFTEEVIEKVSLAYYGKGYKRS